MANFFDNIQPELAVELEQLSKLVYELRENRNVILNTYNVSDEQVLLENICTGKVDEHPAYEHYLAARILAETREIIRGVVSERMKEAKRK